MTEQPCMVVQQTSICTHKVTLPGSTLSRLVFLSILLLLLLSITSAVARKPRTKNAHLYFNGYFLLEHDMIVNTVCLIVLQC